MRLFQCCRYKDFIVQEIALMLPLQGFHCTRDCFHIAVITISLCMRLFHYYSYKELSCTRMFQCYNYKDIAYT